MSLVHHLTNCLIIIPFKGVADIQDPLDLSNDIFGPEEVFLGNLVADLVQPQALGI